MLLTLSLPIIAQNLVTSSLNLLDNVMIGKLGVNEISATGLANNFYMIFYLTTGAICIGAGVLISQYFGKQDIVSIKKYLGISFVFSLSSAIFFASIAFFFPSYIIKFFSKDIDIINLGVSYLKVVAPSYIFTCLSFNYYVALRSTGQTKFLMRGSLIGFVFNGILNYIFIFGKLGVSPMGVTGAALGTTLARAFELLYLLYVVHIKDNIIRPQFSRLFSFNKSEALIFLKTAYPVVLNDLIWVFGVTMYSKAYSFLGTGGIATMQIVNTTGNLFYIFGIGLGVASSIIIGHSIGGGKDIETIQKEGEKMNNFSFILGIFVGIIFFLVAPLINSLFNTTPEIKRNVLYTLRVIAFILPFRFYGLNIILGPFRGGGDLIFATLAEFISMWIIAVPATFIATLYLDITSVPIVYLFVCLEDIFKIFIAYPRFKSSKWIKSLV